MYAFSISVVNFWWLSNRNNPPPTHPKAGFFLLHEKISGCQEAFWHFFSFFLKEFFFSRAFFILIFRFWHAQIIFSRALSQSFLESFTSIYFYVSQPIELDFYQFACVNYDKIIFFYG